MADDIFIHPTSIVETNRIGPGTRIWAFTHVMEEASIGENCNVGEHCFIESGVTVGSHSTIKNGNMLWDGVAIGEGVFVGPGVVFTNDRFPRSPRLQETAGRYQNREWLKKTEVRRGASLGAGAIILPGLIIGEFALIAAGAVVTREVPAHALLQGNPGRRTGWVCHCAQPLRFRDRLAVCSDCGKSFVGAESGIEERGGPAAT